MQGFEGRKAREGRVDWEEGCLATGYGLLPCHKKGLQTCSPLLLPPAVLYL